MPETVDTVKQAKPRAAAGATSASAGTTKKAPAKKQTVAQKVKATTPTHQEIARLAVQYWAERGRQDGQAEQDWLRAERALMQLAS